MTLKTKYTTSNSKPWKQKVSAKQTKPVMSDPGVKKLLEELHQKFVVITIDKASNNFAFTCRKYFISKLVEEVSLNKNKHSTSTYSQTPKLTSNTLNNFTQR